MARASIAAYSQTAGSNTLITDDSTDIGIDEGWSPSNVNNAFRTMMSHLADSYAGDAAWDSVTNSITAGTTQTQAGATELTTIINRVTVSGTDGDGVKLPTAVAGLQVLVINDDSAQTIQVWPNTSDAIDGGSADAVDAKTIPAGGARLYIAVDGTNWYTAIDQLASGSALSVASINLGDETMDTYDEGSWTPDLQFGGGTTGITYGERSGQYTRIGRVVHVHGTFSLTSKGSSNGNAFVEGLPFTSDSPGGNVSWVSGAMRSGSIDLNVAGGYYSMIGFINQNDGGIALQEVGDNVAAAALTDADFGNTSSLYFSITYEVA